MSLLILNKLLVTQDGNNVYSEEFHSGVNIIRGNNSSGKSTISNFIFFVLGGDFNNWLPEAANCDWVFAELSLNGAILTIKREITDKNLQPMLFFWGELEIALQSNYVGWKTYPYSRRSSDTETFSQILFKSLGFPEVSSDNLETITFNQILRLIYIDQLSSLDSLMRNEDFDSPTIRSAIGNLLIGAYDDNLLKKQFDKKEKEKELSEIKKNITALEHIFDNSPFDFNSDSINKDIKEKGEQLSKIIATLKSPETLLEPIRKNDVKNDIKDKQVQLNKIKDAYNLELGLLRNANNAMLDGNDFIEVLELKLNSIKESLNSRQILGSLPIQFCPICMERITENKHEGSCVLCKQETPDSDGRTKLLKMKIEIENQLSESKVLQKDRVDIIEEAKRTIRGIERELTKTQVDYDLLISQSSSTVGTKLNELWSIKGKLDTEIDFLNRQLELTGSYQKLKDRKSQLSTDVDTLSEDIGRLLNLQRKKTTTAYSRIQYYAIELLKGDGSYEDKFQNGESITLSFEKNIFYLDNRNRFSASSMVLLKNCVRFAIFFASLELEYFRYPRFILSDNMEDKGMKEARSQNFQRNIVRLANTFDSSTYQIIFSTSMIDPSLDKDEYTVGDFYDENNKSLKLN